MSEEMIDIVEVTIPYPKSREENERDYFCRASRKMYAYRPERFELIKNHYLAYLQRQAERFEWLAERCGQDDEVGKYLDLAKSLRRYVCSIHDTQDLKELLAKRPKDECLKENSHLISGISLHKAVK